MSKLLEAAVIGLEGSEHALKVRNRVFMAPLTRGRATEDHLPKKDSFIKYYGDRASAGLIFCEATGINPTGLGWFCAPGIYRDEMIQAWKTIVQGVKAQDSEAVLYSQLWHMGRQAHSDVTGTRPVSASEEPLVAPVTARNHEKKPAQVPHALSAQEIEQTVQDYVQAARNAQTAGFDGIEIHAANGYLLDQFMQTVSNKRTDEYGGSIENRLRFLREVVEAVCQVYPKERVSVRLAPNGIAGEMGSAENPELFSAAIEMLARQRVGIIHIMDGLTFGFHDKAEPFTPRMARAIIRRVQQDEGIASMLVCNVGYTKESAQALIREGLEDEGPYVDQAVAFGRPYISNPDLVARFQNNLDLAPEAPYEHWWQGELGEEGYNTYPKL
ncbi:12-oxophytodienoate reductase 1 [Hondaea fermentalgiana]|uniref:12-oxophytodienoate reductase 1 n=1 Tax=Hondaea fermentalgiana TaxID=2315210 RepID=A0A2R5GF66_9STRA|nr:12-oxophytodienoate reductase 1 [Hondaea fermentalgiana]|eukprot:GBG29570.1 12-oxophytodienoate reductase 1 [Hondaea fermentalgiana]